MIREAVEARVDPVLFRFSYDYVGDLAETVALMWPDPEAGAEPPALTDIVETLRTSERGQAASLITGSLNVFDAPTRWAFLKLITGGLRVGVSARLAKTALATLGPHSVEEIEEVWHGVRPPYSTLLAWAEGSDHRPKTEDRLVFRSLMLASPLVEPSLATLDPAAFVAEWKWDGVRVQLVARDGEARLFSRTGDDISRSFPEIIEAVRFDAIIDGELLIATEEDGTGGFIAASFNELQKRLNRKTVSAAMRAARPAFVRAYGSDLRGLTFAARRSALETWHQGTRPGRIDVSPILSFATWEEARTLRAAAPATTEGLMLKRIDSAYLAGRPKGPWFKWKRDPNLIDCVLMYAQRGHGKRSSYYSDYAFGLWRGHAAAGSELVPVGKAYFGFTDEELSRLDSWVRHNTTERFGPVRQVVPALVLEIAFDSVHRSNRHKSGVAMRFPRVHRIRWDKPAAQADELAALVALIAP